MKTVNRMVGDVQIKQLYDTDILGMTVQSMFQAL